MKYGPVILFMVLILPIGCLSNGNNPLTQLSISPAGGGIRQTYLIVLDKQGYYNIKSGMLDPNKELALIEVEENKTILLGDKELKEIVQLIKQFNKLKNIKKKDNILNDGLDLNIKTDNNAIIIFYNEISEYDPLIKKLVEKILKLSPIDLNIPKWWK